METPKELEERVRKRAYEIWELEGRIYGKDVGHWHRAAKEVEEEAEHSVICARSAEAVTFNKAEGWTRRGKDRPGHSAGRKEKHTSWIVA